jgi:hypothetical protein
MEEGSTEDVAVPTDVSPVGAVEEYDFHNVETRLVTMANGAVYPRLSCRVVRRENDNWRPIGNFTVRLDKVQRDSEDAEDVAINFRTRVNPKAD